MFSGDNSANFFHTVLFATVLAVFALIFGAYARLSEATLVCPGWAECSELSYNVLPGGETISGGGDGEDTYNRTHRAWKDMVQHYLAAALVLILLRLTYLGWKLKKKKHHQQYLIPAIVIVLITSAAVLEVYAVEPGFKPLVQMAQFLGGMMILALLWWIVMREQRFWRSHNVTTVTRSLRIRTLLGLVIVFLLATFGGWSSVNFAVLACPDFPTCQSQWWPAADYVNGFTLWWEQAVGYNDELLSLTAATGIHMAHRIAALIALLYIGWLAFHVLHVGVQNNLCRYGFLLLLPLVVGTTLGVMNVVMQLPITVAVAHHGVAVLLLLSMVSLYHVVHPPRST